MEIPGRLGRVASECDAIIQVALDFKGLWDAVRIARVIPESPMVSLEAGTPLIKYAGIDSLRVLRAMAGDRVVVADTKTVDTGGLEVSMAGEGGADAATVLSAASDETIREAVEAGRGAGVAVYVDLITSRDPLGDLERIESLGAHAALLHLGIDVQRSLGIRASQRGELVKSMAEGFRGLVAVAGGVRPAEVGALYRAGARIIVLGSAITRAPDPRRAVEEALEGLRGAGAKCR